MRSSGWLVPVLVGVMFFLAIGGYVLGVKEAGKLFKQDVTSSVQVIASMQPVGTASAMASASATASAKPILPGVSPTQVTDSFYKAYIACRQKGQEAASCMTSTGYTSNDFSQTIAGRDVGGDPVLCATIIPPSVQVGRESIFSNLATTYVTEMVNGTAKSILVNLTSDTGNWRITDISCPRS